jgi:hypothetical protein
VRTTSREDVALFKKERRVIKMLLKGKLYVAGDGQILFSEEGGVCMPLESKIRSVILSDRDKLEDVSVTIDINLKKS